MRILKDGRLKHFQPEPAEGIDPEEYMKAVELKEPYNRRL
jgi:hypothetical protein